MPQPKRQTPSPAALLRGEGSRGLRSRLRALALGSVLFGVGAAGCNQVSFLLEAPEPRGITIPLPPPSLTSEPLQRFDIEGELDPGVPDDGTRVQIYEKRSQRGYFSYAMGGSWLIQDVLVDVTDNCLAVSSYDENAEQSVVQDVQLVFASGEACVPGCTEPDTEDVCVCFEKRNTGC